MKDTKKTKKRILGLLGLVLVIITTIFAVFLPEPGASAVNNTSVTDQVLVRVVGSVPDVTITSPINGSIFVIPDQSLSFDYENVTDTAITIDYTNKDDVTTTYILDSFNANYYPGSRDYSIDLLGSDYGYGKYLVKATGDGYGLDNVAEDLVEFFFYPVYGEAEEDESDGLIYLNLHYDTESENIKNIKVNIYDEDGYLVGTMSPINVASPNVRVELPFSEKGMPTGNYKIEITAYNEEGEVLYKPYYTSVYYETIPAPDTGAFFTNLGISKTDYLVTALIVFMLVSVFSIVFVARKEEAIVKK